jgi:hypothetical protein
MSNQPRARRAGAGAGARTGAEVMAGTVVGADTVVGCVAQAASSAAGARIATEATLRSSDLRVICLESAFILRVRMVRVMETLRLMINYFGTVKPFIA